MNQTTSPSSLLNSLDTLQSRYALRVASALTQNSDRISADLGERLRFAREQALGKARLARQAETAAPKVGVTAGGAAVLGGPWGGGSRWWFKLASAAPLLALVAGLVMIQKWQDNAQISTAAEIDAALLSDDLPPNAYSDAGFAEFLKTPPRE